MAIDEGRGVDQGRLADDHSRALADFDETQNRIDPALIALRMSESGTVDHVSPAIEDLLGLSVADVVGRQIASIVDPNDAQRMRDFLALGTSPTEPGPRIAVRFVDAASRPVWMEATLGAATGSLRTLEARPYAPRVQSMFVGPGSRSDSNRYHALVQNSADIVMVFDPDGTVRFANPAMLRTLGLAPADLLGTQILELIHDDDKVAITATMIGVLEEPAISRRVEFRARHADGNYRWIEGGVQNLLDHPEVGGILGNGRDITDRRNAEAALRESEERFRSLAASSPSAIFEFDVHGRLRYANDRWSEITGYGVDFADEIWDVIHPDDVESLRKELSSDAVSPGLDARVRVIRADRSQRWVEIRTRAVTVGGSQVDGHVGTIHDVTELHHYQVQLAHQALHDPLTKLPNRVMLLERLTVALDRSRTQQEPLALLFVDLDHFKVINDSLGHNAGDEVLVTVARRLSQLVRPGDLVTRFGGDEFVVLCEDIGDREQAMALAQRLQRKVSGQVDVGESQVHVSVSIGVIVGDGNQTPGDLLRDADAAMYEAKVRGRDRAQAFDDELHRAAVSRLTIEGALRQGIERDEFVLHYQPIVDVITEEVMGAEALIRWRHPTEGVLEPDRFLAIADASGLLKVLGSWVVDTACREATSWPTCANGEAAKICVNLSGDQLADPRLANEIDEILARTNLDPWRLHLEVTEGSLMAGAGAAAKVLHDLRDLGVRTAIDDFGTGYSSLSYLTRLPVDVLKIDRSFVYGMGTRSGDYEVTATIIALAHTLGLNAIAEGVETRDQLSALRALGCDSAQGFLFDRALPVEQFIKRLGHSVG